MWSPLKTVYDDMEKDKDCKLQAKKTTGKLMNEANFGSLNSGKHVLLKYSLMG